MLTPNDATELRELIARHAHYQFQAGRLERRKDSEAQRARVLAASDATTRALCARLAQLTKEYE